MTQRQADIKYIFWQQFSVKPIQEIGMNSLLLYQYNNIAIL